MSGLAFMPPDITNGRVQRDYFLWMKAAAKQWRKDGVTDWSLQRASCAALRTNWLAEAPQRTSRPRKHRPPLLYQILNIFAHNLSLNSNLQQRTSPFPRLAGTFD